MVMTNFKLAYRPSEKYAKYYNICRLMITLGLFCVKRRQPYRYPFEFGVIRSFPLLRAYLTLRIKP